MNMLFSRRARPALALAVLLLAGLTLAAPARAEVCTGNFVLDTQAAVDAFACTSVTNSLTISGGGIDNLLALTGLQFVGENLRVASTTSLGSISGLSGLTEVGFNLDIDGNASLRSLNGLSGLTKVGGTLFINGNASLGSLDGLSGLTSVGEAPTNIANSLNSLSIVGNPSLTSLHGLSGLTSVGGALFINGNGALLSLDGLAGITSLIGLLGIQNNASLASVSGLSGLTSVGGVFINGNAALASLNGLAGITTVGGQLDILNTALTSLDGLSGLTTVGGPLRIQGNASLTSVSGLAELASVGGLLTIENNGTLASLDGLAGLTTVEGFLIKDNFLLASVSGLDGLESVQGTLWISDNASLASLDGLAALTSVRTNIFITTNPVLASISGLAGLTIVGGSLAIAENTALSTCSCGLAGLISGDPPAFSGVAEIVSILDNAGTCISPEVVLANPCATTEPPANTPPVADAGADQTVFAGQTVTLDGSGSSDPDGDALTYAWTLTDPEGNPATLSDDSAVKPTFVAAVRGTYSATLVVNDGTANSDRDEVEIDVLNRPPVANAGDGQTVFAGQTVTLDGSASSDPDGDALTYAWTLNGPAGDPLYTDEALTGEAPTFCAAEPGTYTASLIVRDGGDDSEPAEVTVTAISAFDALDELTAAVTDLQIEDVLSAGQARGLTRNLVSAERHLARGHTSGALDALAGFRQQALDLWQNDGVLTEEQAMALVDAADAIIGALAEPCTTEGDAPEAAAGIDTSLPTSFALAAAYPNPLRSSATLSFDVAEASDVRVAVYDVQGRQVAVLAEGRFEAASHQVVFDASALPNGLYLVRMSTNGGFSQTQRLTVLR